MSAERSSLFFVPETQKIVQNRVTEKIFELAETALEGSGFFLVDVEIKGADEPVVWVFVDAEDRGVNMDECASLSREIGFLMDAHDIFNGRYRLNVSSPGLSRPITDIRQYRKNQGRKSKIKYRDDGDYQKVEGTIDEVSDVEVTLKEENGTVQHIPFDRIVETKIIPSL